MQHLGYLKIMNFIFGGLMALLAVLVALGGLASVGLTFASTGTDAIGSLIVSAVVYFIMFAIMAAFSLMYFVAGRKVGQAKGRILQSILGVMSLGSFPFGTIYGGYALWLCWANEETKPLFEQGGI